ncbi:hypothetical protein SAMN02745673_04310 [Marinactinospora thermotolerans DSM 45154]|uniref:Uncharacterized protein n=1 Tax=Marinactinospora thermotolerans DSM 45154 TaxID=1122192 RepID=A0A1T4T2N7_9ACTN|nr:hypothetical protein SAMN02745673_04310 [Marinactinospora thermotolerans DSM 45154]
MSGMKGLAVIVGAMLLFLAALSVVATLLSP